ncbi:MAG: amino-acid N-acetyltransferase [Treponema sp.]|nr:amino-acid N-acetyltransferase [Treponema sp.]
MVLMNQISNKKAENVRDVIRYLKKFHNALIVIYLDDKTISSALFSSHIRDIALLHEAGLKVVIIPGARARIDEVLEGAKIDWTYKNNIRVTNDKAMPLIKMAAFDVSNTVMTNLAANNITAVIGNWVRARAKGVLEGFDFGAAGEIDRLDTASLNTVLNDGFIPIFPCIGWSATGKPYNISSAVLAQQVAVELKADKLFFVMGDQAPILKDGEIVPAMNIEELDSYVVAHADDEQIKNLLALSKTACLNGVNRSHILDGNLDGVLLTEIFSDLGSGTMIYTNNYGKIRQMEQTDIPSVLGVMRPFVEAGKLLPRTEADVAAKLEDFYVYDFDGGVRACASLHKYDDGQFEIAAVAVDEAYSHIGIGPKLVESLVQKAKSCGAKSVFIMTTQASDWFEKIGFAEDKIDSIPDERKKLWSPERGSKVYRLK